VVLRHGKHPERTYETPEKAQEDGAVTENIGRFIMTLINFILVAITLFVIVYTAQKFSDMRERRRLKHHSNGDAAPEATKPEPSEASGATKTCPWCSANVPIKAVKCMYCTSFLHEKVPAELLNKTPQTALIELDG